MDTHIISSYTLEYEPWFGNIIQYGCWHVRRLLWQLSTACNRRQYGLMLARFGAITDNCLTWALEMALM